jgi:DNA-binding MarR family transcriptional regulator
VTRRGTSVADLQNIRADIERNCKRFAADPEASALAMDLLLTLRRTATTFQTMAEFFTREFALSPTKVSILMRLVATPRHTLAQSQIGRDLFVSLSNLNTQLVSLEEAGLIRRRTSSTDSRVTNISLTAKGLAFVGGFAPVQFGAVAEALQGLNATEQRNLIKLLDKMRNQAKPRKKHDA